MSNVYVDKYQIRMLEFITELRGQEALESVVDLMAKSGIQEKNLQEAVTRLCKKIEEKVGER